MFTNSKNMHQVLINLTEEQYEFLYSIKIIKNQPMSEQIREAIDAYIEKNQTK